MSLAVFCTRIALKYCNFFNLHGPRTVIFGCAISNFAKLHLDNVLSPSIVLYFRVWCHLLSWGDSILWPVAGHNFAKSAKSTTENQRFSERVLTNFVHVSGLISFYLYLFIYFVQTILSFMHFGDRFPANLSLYLPRRLPPMLTQLCTVEQIVAKDYVRWPICNFYVFEVASFKLNWRRH